MSVSGSVVKVVAVATVAACGGLIQSYDTSTVRQLYIADASCPNDRVLVGPIDHQPGDAYANAPFFGAEGCNSNRLVYACPLVINDDGTSSPHCQRIDPPAR